MYTISPKVYYEILKSQSERLLPPGEYSLMVPREKQQKEIENLKKSIGYERFFFVVNNLDFGIENAYGVSKWLGYSDKDFTYLKYSGIIHPSHLVAQMANVYELMESFLSGQWPVSFMSMRFISCMALRHNNGEYLLFKRLAWPFQHDNKNRLISYLNEFTLLGPYNNESYTMRLTDVNGNFIDWHDELLARTKRNFEKNTPFSVQELRVLRKYADEPAITSSELAGRFNLKESTVITYKKRIISKAEKVFHQRFKNAKDVAEFLRDQGFV